MAKEYRKTSLVLATSDMTKLDETAEKMGISRSDLIRMAIKKELYRLGVLKPEGLEPIDNPTPKVTANGGE